MLYSSLQDLTDAEASLKQHNVKQQKQGSNGFCGLLVNFHHAERFVHGPSVHRKVMEIRSRPVNFLKPGERIVLISCGGGQPRQLLAILEFQQCLRIDDDVFDRFYPLHQVSAEELAGLKQTWSKQNTFCYGYQFSLIYKFPKKLVLKLKTGEIWVYFKKADLACGLPVEEWEFFREPLTVSSLPGHSSSLDIGTTSGTLSAADTPEPRVSEHVGGEEHECEDECNVDGPVHCILLTRLEWAALSQQRCNFLLRPFQSHENDLTAIVRLEEGHCVVGNLHIERLREVASKDLSSLVESSMGVYSKTQEKAMKSNKNQWVWDVSVEIFELPSLVRFLDVAPRFRNRPFVVKKRDLCAHRPDTAPKAMTLLETARFFFEYATEEMQNRLLQVLENLQNQTIRIGTTCSGSDVCVTVLEKTVQFFNKLKAGRRTCMALGTMFPP